MMSDFDYDCWQKKQLARQAKYRKNGSKSRKCSMSTDRMTQRQWEKLNGEVITMNLNQPMQWKEFKGLTASLQEEYLKHLISRFDVNAASLGKMFNVHTVTVRNYIRDHNLNVRFAVGHSMDRDHKSAWEVFLGNCDEPAESTDENENAVTAAANCSSEIRSKTAEDDIMTMNQFSMRFSGKFNADMIANTLRYMVSDGTIVDITISCNFSEG